MDIIINQILIMATLMTLGFILRKLGYFNDEVTSGLSSFLLRIIIPLTIIESFIQEFNFELLKMMAIIAFITVIFTFIIIFICEHIFKSTHHIEKFASVFSNRGFIGIPIIRSLFGTTAIPYLTPIIFVGHLFMWTYGINLLSEEKQKLKFSTVFLNPNAKGVWIGLIIFILPISLPAFLDSSVRSLTAINTPLAMIILGVYLANENLREIFTNKMGYYVSFVRLVLLPAVSIAFMYFMPFDILVKQVFVIAMSVPSAANTAMFSELLGQNPSYGAQLVSLNTILSALTLPVVIMIMQSVF